MAQSNAIPERIKQYKNEIYITSNIVEHTKFDEMMEEEVTYYEYDYIMLKGYTQEFVEKYFDDIFTNPEKYNVVQLNSTFPTPKGEGWAAAQMANEKDLSVLNETVEQLIIDSLGV